MTQNTWKAVGMLLLAGLIGAALGAAATARMHGPGPMGGSRRGADWYVEMLGHELELTPAQRDTVRDILERHRPAMDSIWGEVNPRMKAWREGLRADIRSHLTPEQQRRYAEFTARRDAEREQRSTSDSTKR